jgi:hypothetical protein
MIHLFHQSQLQKIPQKIQMSTNSFTVIKIAQVIGSLWRHLIKLEQYRENLHGPCARIPHINLSSITNATTIIHVLYFICKPTTIVMYLVRHSSNVQSTVLLSITSAQVA